MINAHTRIGMIEFSLTRKKTSTRVRAYFDRFAKEKNSDKAHMVSLFGNDSEISAFAAAIYSDERLVANCPDGMSYTLQFGKHASTYKGHIALPGRRRPIRHLLAFSEDMISNGARETVYMLNQKPEFVWSTLVSFLGLPAIPEWASAAVNWLQESGKVVDMEGYQCEPFAIKTTRKKMLDWIGEGVKNKILPFPEYDGPILWPYFGLESIVPPITHTSEPEEIDNKELAVA
jgi:hypothetical protein